MFNNLDGQTVCNFCLSGQAPTAELVNYFKVHENLKQDDFTEIQE